MCLARKPRKKDGDFFDKLREKTKEIKEVGTAIGKTTIEKGEEVGKQISTKGKEGIDKGISAAKKGSSSDKEVIELIEKLAKLKEDGYLTEEEFKQEKKKLLARL